MNFDEEKLMRVYESDVRTYFPYCPICYSKRIQVKLISGGRDAVFCENCNASWHIYVGLTGFKWGELEIEAPDGRGKDLLGKRMKGKEWRKMAMEGRRSLSSDQLAAIDQQEAKLVKEVIKEKEVIVKVRCSYCHNLYNETLDKCPHCGARR